MQVFTCMSRVAHGDGTGAAGLGGRRGALNGRSPRGDQWEEISSPSRVRLAGESRAFGGSNLCPRIVREPTRCRPNQAQVRAGETIEKTRSGLGGVGESLAQRRSLNQ